MGNDDSGVDSPYLILNDDQESDEVEGENPYLTRNDDTYNVKPTPKVPEVVGENLNLVESEQDSTVDDSPNLIPNDDQVKAPTIEQIPTENVTGGASQYLVEDHEEESVEDNPYLINDLVDEPQGDLKVSGQEEAPSEKIDMQIDSSYKTKKGGNNNNFKNYNVSNYNVSNYNVGNYKTQKVGNNPYALNSSDYDVKNKKGGNNPYALNSSDYNVKNKYTISNNTNDKVDSPYAVESKPKKKGEEPQTVPMVQTKPTVIKKDPMKDYKGKGQVQPDTKWTQKSQSTEMNHWDTVGKLLSEGKVEEAQQLQEPTGRKYYKAPTVTREGKKPKTWAPQVSEHKSGPLMQSLDEHYRGEETGSSLADKDGGLATEIGGKRMTNTYYAKDDKEFGTQIQDGRLTQNGKVVNSTNNFSSKGKELTPGNKALYVQKDKHERVNFAMDGKGSLFTGDVRTETDRRMDPNEGSGQRHNHSSLVGGKDVSAAGTLKVREGKVEEIGDNSGHYKPSLSHMQQAIGHLQGQGVMDEQRSSVRLGKKGPNRDLVISGTEMSGWKGEIDKSRETFEKTDDRKALDVPEQKIRAMHQKKSTLQDDLVRTDQAIPDFDPNAKMTFFGQQRNPVRIDRFQNDGVVEESTIQPSKVKAVSQHEQKKKAESERRTQERKLEEQRRKEEIERRRQERKQKNVNN